MTDVSRANAQALIRARKRVSAEKRQQVVDAIAAMQRQGIRITYAKVAKTALVSEGLVHSRSLKPIVSEAIAAQKSAGVEPLVTEPPGSAVSNQSLRQDIQLFQDELREVRRENAALLSRLGRSLGAEIEALGQRDAVERIDSLERSNRELLSSVDDLTAQVSSLQEQTSNLTDDLVASRAAHRNLMKRINSTD